MSRLPLKAKVFHQRRRLWHSRLLFVQSDLDSSHIQDHLDGNWNASFFNFPDLFTLQTVFHWLSSARIRFGIDQCNTVHAKSPPALHSLRTKYKQLGRKLKGLYKCADISIQLDAGKGHFSNLSQELRLITWSASPSRILFSLSSFRVAVSPEAFIADCFVKRAYVWDTMLGYDLISIGNCRTCLWHRYCSPSPLKLLDLRYVFDFFEGFTFLLDLASFKSLSRE